MGLEDRTLGVNIPTRDLTKQSALRIWFNIILLKGKQVGEAEKKRSRAQLHPSVFRILQVICSKEARNGGMIPRTEASEHGTTGGVRETK